MSKCKPISPQIVHQLALIRLQSVDYRHDAIEPMQTFKKNLILTLTSDLLTKWSVHTEFLPWTNGLPSLLSTAPAVRTNRLGYQLNGVPHGSRPQLYNRRGVSIRGFRPQQRHNKSIQMNWHKSIYRSWSTLACQISPWSVEGCIVRYRVPVYTRTLKVQHLSGF